MFVFYKHILDLGLFLFSLVSLVILRKKMYTVLQEDTWPKNKPAQRKDNSVPSSSYLAAMEEEKTNKSYFTYVFQ